MSNMNKVKSEQLGMSFSTANQRLRKSIMFMLIEKCGLNICYRCGKEMTIDNFSIEHKKEWLHSENPVELFYDLDNISFSHHICNITHARKPEVKRKSEEALLKHHISKSRTGFLGVYHYPEKKKPYRARVRLGDGLKSLGYYSTAEECAKVVDKALREHYGEEVVTNESMGLI